MSNTSADDVRADLLAEIAHFVLGIARRIHTAPHDDPDFIALTQLEGMIMQTIERSPGISPRELAAELHLHGSNTSAALRELERKGMIRREADPDDGRAIRISETPAARTNLTRLRSHLARLLDPIEMDAEQLATTAAALAEIDESLAARSDRLTS